MTPSRIGFSTSPTWNPLSGLIRWVTGSTASHCYFVFFDETLGCEMVMEAHWFFQCIEYSTWLTHNRVVAEFEWRKPDGGSYVLDAVRHAKDWLGTGYDVAGLLGEAPVIIARRWLKMKLRNMTQNSKAMFCSEACETGLLQAGAPIPASAVQPHEASPGDLLSLNQMMADGAPSIVQRYLLKR